MCPLIFILKSAGAPGRWIGNATPRSPKLEISQRELAHTDEKYVIEKHGMSAEFKAERLRLISQKVTSRRTAQ
jgi:hypothetical protein